ncbi:MAG: DNA polymerase III subunit epsilon [Paenibacillaceae bacterium ZCTH02-B3]|nr:MAG: DNA polymerase III subunit epsilon [Paenibacillaceae bacterium ZCTH02-B3]
MKPWNPFNRFMELYRSGGLPTSLASLDETNAQQIAFLRSMLRDIRQQRENGAGGDVPLDELQAVVFDLETTGFHPQNGDEIISVGAAAVRGPELVEGETMYSLVNPRRPIPPEIEKLTSITNEMVKDAPDTAQVLIQFFRFVRDRVLIAHASGHDRRFLDIALRRRTGASLTHRVLDTMMIACKLYPDRLHYTLDDWLDFYGIERKGRHHALQDAIMTARLWSALLGELASRQVRTLYEMYAFLGRT